MSTGSNIAQALDGPLGWIAVAAVVGVVLYVVYEKTAAQIDLTEAQASGDVQGFQCWISRPSCVASSLLGLAFGAAAS